jgi:hypothetical protein
MNELQKKYIGKHLLVGLTYLEKDESIREQVQFHGKITAISENTVVFKRNDNGEEFSIPYDKENLEAGDTEAVYKLKSTGEAIENVDFISSWTIHPPNEETDL